MEDHLDMNVAKIPVSMEEEAAQSRDPFMNSACDGDIKERRKLKKAVHPDDSNLLQDVAPHTESPCPQEDVKTYEEPTSDSFQAPALPDMKPSESLTTGEPSSDGKVSSNDDSNAKKNGSASCDTILEHKDGPNCPVHEDSQEACNDDADPCMVEECSGPDSEEENVPDQISSAQKTIVGHSRIDDIGPVMQKREPLEESGVNKAKRIVAAIVLLIIAILVHHLDQPMPQVKNVEQMDTFLREMERVQTEFPHQRADLWSRSRIHLERHLQTAQPSEPVSLILTAGLEAKKTLQCLSQNLASVYSSAVNASVLHIDGASKAYIESDTVKLEIDSLLQEAFEGDAPVAVINQFDELPPGSTLIFYRYCDHANAAYKNTFLLFTILLSMNEIPKKLTLSMVEEMVDDHLQRKFLTDGQPVSFDRMDLEKYGGLWSRISHLILPVAREERIEEVGC